MGFELCYYRIDDIEDNSILRRGIPVAHSIYGIASTINSANYVLFLALEKVQQLGHPEVSCYFFLSIAQGFSLLLSLNFFNYNFFLIIKN